MAADGLAEHYQVLEELGRELSCRHKSIDRMLTPWFRR